MRYSLSKIALAALMGVACSGPVAAQRPRTWRLGVAGGTSSQTNLAEYANGDADKGRHWQASIAFTEGDSPARMRADVMRHRFEERRESNPCPQVYPGCTEYQHRSTNHGATLSRLAELGGTKVRPYVIGGMGGYRRTNETTTLPPPCTACDELNSAPVTSRTVTSHFGLNSGLGLAVHLGAFEIFAEARYHRMFASGKDIGMIPITAGVLF